jgi:hypothetical protein
MTDLSEFEREWTELLNEVRVVLPGVQLLFAFLLTAPFTDRFAAITPGLHGVFVGSPLSAIATSMTLLGFGWLWFLLPLSRRWRDRDGRPA